MSDESITFARPSGEPLPPEVFLSKNYRGKYVLKVTVLKDPKLVGERLTIPLRTADPATALLKRDAVIEAFQYAGIMSREISINENVGQYPALPEKSKPIT